MGETMALRMKKSVESETISHAYIFEGNPAKIQQSAFDFIKAILCEAKNGKPCGHCRSCQKVNHGNHEDVIRVSLSENSIKDEVILELQGRLAKKPYVGVRNVAVIECADAMTLRAQNRLLKTLEEPAGEAVIILLCQNTENLISTILSRCVIYRFSSEEGVELNEYRLAAAKLGSMILEGEPFYKQIQASSDFIKSKEEAVGFLSALGSWFRDLMIVPYLFDGALLTDSADLPSLIQTSRLYKREQVYGALDAITAAKRDLDQNLNIAYTIKDMILRMM